MKLSTQQRRATKFARLLVRTPSLSRADAMDALGLSPAVLSGLVRDLVDLGLAEEIGRTGLHTGRSSYPLGFRADWGCFLGLEIEAARTLAVCVDADGHELAAVDLPTEVDRDADQARADGLRAIEQLRTELPADHGPVRGIGFADPGMIDTASAISLRAVQFPGWESFDSAAWLQETTGLPCHVHASPAARAYAEWLACDLPRSKSLLHLSLDDGVGSAFIQEGSPFTGETCSAMEIGHVVVDDTPSAPICHCGNRGCLESVIGRQRLQERVKEIERYGVASRLYDQPRFAVDHLVESVHHSDKSAWAMAVEVSEYVGKALATAVTLLNPGVVTVSGRFTKLGDLLLSEINRALHARTLPAMTASLELRLSTLGESGTARGAALLARNACVEQMMTDHFTP